MNSSRLNIVNIDSLFDDYSVDDELFAFLNDGNDSVLNKSYDEFEINNLLNDGNDIDLNKSYDNYILSQNVKEFFEDANDNILNDAYDQFVASNSYLLPFNSTLDPNIPNTSSGNRQLKIQDMFDKVIKSYEKFNEKKLIGEPLKEFIRNRDRMNHDAFKAHISDIFWSTEDWPNFALEILIGKVEFNWHNRLALATFFHRNGLRDADEAKRIFTFYNPHWDSMPKWNQRFYHFEKLFEYLEKAHQLDSGELGEKLRNNYWYYDMKIKQTMYYDGFIRGPNGEKIPVNKYPNFKI